MNHNGQLDLALQLVDAAAAAGADAVKFQTFRAESVVSAMAPKAPYQMESTGSSGSQLEMVRGLELSHSDHRALVNRCAERGIDFLSSPFDLESIDFLVELGLGTLKIPSGAITDLPYLRAIGAAETRIIMSTGMATLDEVAAALQVLEEAGTPRATMTVLQCTTEYPTASEDVNLLAMLTLRDTFKVAVGYSDHTTGIEVPIAATALGASVIEKHFTLDRTLPGPDQAASLEPEELAEMVRAIRVVEVALGDGVKRPTAMELENAAVARKSIVATRRIAAGEPFSGENLTTKRPGTGISPMLWDTAIGTIAPRDFEPDEVIEL